ncbi:hypothetical protein [Actinokineospora sp.]
MTITADAVTTTTAAPAKPLITGGLTATAVAAVVIPAIARRLAA